MQTSECTKLKNTPDLLFKLTGKAHPLCLNKIQVSQWKLTCELSKDGNKVSETAVKGWPRLQCHLYNSSISA